MATYFGLERHLWAFIVGGLATAIAIIISLHHIACHIKYNCNHVLQKYTLVILGMVPVYALIAYLGLVNKNYTYAYDSLRECYEAIVIYAFFQFLVAYLAKGKNYVEYLQELTRQTIHSDSSHHLFPMYYCLKPWAVGPQFLVNTMFGTFQYVLVKFFCGFLILLFSFFGVYKPGYMGFDNGYVYIVIIASISQMWAMYCLVMFYHHFKQDLAGIRPLAKFICIKAVVFFTFWQGVLISGLVSAHTIHQTATYTTEQSSEGLQDFIICLEMLVATLAHRYAFPEREFYDENHIIATFESPTERVMAMIWPYVMHQPENRVELIEHDFCRSDTNSTIASVV